MVYSSNRYLTQEEMTTNAQYLLNEFSSYGWSKNAIAGMLGNMQVESTINPGVWQNLNEGNMSGGFGLVQWTPASNYISWANDNGYDRGDINGQIQRILYELENGLQYIETTEYPLSFQEFSVSDESPEWLASAFLKNYERAGVEAENERRQNARYWFDNLEVGEGGSKPAFPTTAGLPITSPYGWRTHPVTGERDFHAAIDISGQGQEHPIYATQTGEVVVNQWSESAGWMVIIRHTADRYWSRYIHLKEKSPVIVGENVIKGQEIGTMGSTGVSTGIHLDFAISTTGSFGSEATTIDPELYLEMEFDSDPSKPPQTETVQDIIVFYLSNVLNWGLKK